jgi:hypothetical protein
MWVLNMNDEAKKAVIHRLIESVDSFEVEEMNFDHYKFIGFILEDKIELEAVYHETDINNIIKEMDESVKIDKEPINTYRELKYQLVYKLTEWEVYGYE